MTCFMVILIVLLGIRVIELQRRIASLETHGHAHKPAPDDNLGIYAAFDAPRTWVIDLKPTHSS